MRDLDKIADSFGSLIDAQFAHTDPSHFSDPAVRSEVVRMTSHGRRSFRLIHKVSLSAAALAILLGAAMLLRTYTTPPVSFLVDNGARPSSIGQWLRTKADERCRIRFSDGSGIEIKERTETRIVEADTKRVIVDLNGGGMYFHVSQDRGNQWTVRAGPFQVFVVGTRFTVHWDANSSAFRVDVAKGNVRVMGPGISADGVSVTAGNILKGNAETGVIAFGPDEKLRNAEVTVRRNETPGGVQKDTVETTESLSSSAPRPEPSEAQVQNWKRLSAAGKYREAFRAADESGWRALGRTIPEKELWLLANTARYAEKSDAARSLFALYRSRFSKNPKSHTAAYLAGLTAALEPGGEEEAVTWLETYLREGPKEASDEEVRGRLMHLLVEVGRTADARRLAADYLRRYPGGPFTERAQRLLKI